MNKLTTSHCLFPCCFLESSCLSGGEWAWFLVSLVCPGCALVVVVVFSQQWAFRNLHWGRMNPITEVDWIGWEKEDGRGVRAEWWWWHVESTFQFQQQQRDAATSCGERSMKVRGVRDMCGGGAARIWNFKMGATKELKDEESWFLFPRIGMRSSVVVRSTNFYQQIEDEDVIWRDCALFERGVCTLSDCRASSHAFYLTVKALDFPNPSLQFICSTGVCTWIRMGLLPIRLLWIPREMEFVVVVAVVDGWMNSINSFARTRVGKVLWGIKREDEPTSRCCRFRQNSTRITRSLRAHSHPRLPLLAPSASSLSPLDGRLGKWKQQAITERWIHIMLPSLLSLPACTSWAINQTDQI